MAISVVASTEASTTNLTDGSSVVINKPAGTASGDFLVAVLSGPYTGSIAWTAPSGWTLAASDHAAVVSLESRIYTLTAGASEPSSYTWSTTGGAGSYAGIIVTYRGTTGLNAVTGANPNDTVGTLSTTPSEPGVTAPVFPGLGTYAVSWHAVGSTGMSSTGNIGTEQNDITTTDGTPSAHERGVAVYTHGTAHGAGSYTGTGTTTLNHAPTASIIWSIDLVEAGDVEIATILPHLGSSWVASRTNRLTGSSILPHLTDVFVAGRAGPLVEFLINGVWTDITADIRYEEAITVTRGRTAEGTTMSTSVATFKLDNRVETVNNRWSLHNVNGMYYRQIGRNMQCRISKLEGSYRFWGEVSSWTPGADDTNNDQWVSIECSGIVRRLEATSAPLLPALQREIANASPQPIGYWPMDDQQGATSIASPMPGVPDAQVKGGIPDYQNYTKLIAAGTMPQINDAAVIFPYLPTATLDPGVTFSFFLASPGGMTNGNEIFTINPVGGQGGLQYWGLGYSDTDELTMNVFPLADSGGAIVGNVPIVGTNGVMIYMSVSYVSGTGRFHLYYQSEGDAVATLVGSSIWGLQAGEVLPSGFVGRLNPRYEHYSDTSAMYFGQVAQWSGYAIPYTFQSTGAWAGEAAGDRFLRLCTEQNVPAVCANSSDSARMGVQGAKAFMDLVRECEATDLGILTETRSSFGLEYKIRSGLYNKAADVILDCSNNELSQQLNPVFDDKGVQNDVTVQRDGGSSARYQVLDGPLSIQAAPDGVGPYTSSVTVSLAEDFDCYAQAGWRAHLSTVDEERVASVGVALENQQVDSNHNLKLNILSVDSGSRVMVINTPSWIQPVDQIVQGFSERFDNFGHQITYNTSSAKPYTIAVAPTIPTNTSAKADSLTSTLDADITSTATSFNVDDTTTLWTTSGNDFDINVAGEQMTVTGVSGISSPQTFTVIRSVNGVVKLHSAGDQVSLWQPSIIAL